ncbi:hypothetical protein RFI_04426, partial [Reticulomyxa filosa]
KKKKKKKKKKSNERFNSEGLMKLRINSAGGETYMHFDSTWNHFLQVYGEKIFILISPEQINEWKPYPAIHPHSSHSQRDDLFSHHRNNNNNNNNNDNQEEGNNKQMKDIWIAHLKAGDILVIPPYWAHHVITSPDMYSISLHHWMNSMEYLLANHVLYAYPLPFEATWPLHVKVFALLEYFQNVAGLWKRIKQVRYLNLLEMDLLMRDKSKENEMKSICIDHKSDQALWKTHAPQHDDAKFQNAQKRLETGFPRICISLQMQSNIFCLKTIWNMFSICLSELNMLFHSSFIVVNRFLLMYYYHFLISFASTKQNKKKNTKDNSFMEMQGANFDLKKIEIWKMKLYGGMQNEPKEAETKETTNDSQSSNDKRYERELKVLMLLCNNVMTKEQLKQKLEEKDGHVSSIIEDIVSKLLQQPVFI